MLKLERISDYLKIEQEFIENQEKILEKSKTKVEGEEEQENPDLQKIEKMRGTPISIGSLEEFVDENHCIISGNTGPEYYVGITSFVDKD